MAKLKQSRCPNCGAKLDTRRYVYDGYILSEYGERQDLYYERKSIKCDYCRSEFELCEEEE